MAVFTQRMLPEQECPNGYILSGHYASIRDILNAAKNTFDLKRSVFYLPIRIAKMIAPVYEKWSLQLFAKSVAKHDKRYRSVVETQEKIAGYIWKKQ
ncbi:MAG: hypothetical protein ACOX75_08420 [Lachnospiraceae bacterium]|jgi:hypothetical protein